MSIGQRDIVLTLRGDTERKQAGGARLQSAEARAKAGEISAKSDEIWKPKYNSAPMKCGKCGDLNKKS